jgi:hypothetical protein
MDSLHKVRPLLQILKRSIGRYATFGLELSFDEALPENSISRYTCYVVL